VTSATLKKVTLKNRANAHRRREKIKEFIEECGFSSVNPKVLAKKYSVCKMTIYNDMKVIIREWPLQSLKPVQITIGIALNKALGQSMKDLRHDDFAARGKAASNIARLSQGITNYAEAWLGKEKAPDRVIVDDRRDVAAEVVDAVFSRHLEDLRKAEVVEEKDDK